MPLCSLGWGKVAAPPRRLMPEHSGSLTNPYWGPCEGSCSRVWLGSELAPAVDLMVPQRRGNFPLKTAPRLARPSHEVNPPHAELAPPPRSPPRPHRHKHILGSSETLF